MFIGRKPELATLGEAYRAKGSRFVLIHGRRRIGKTELLLRFLRGKPGIYHQGKTAPAALQIREFLRQAARATRSPQLASHPATDWKAALRAAIDGPGRGKKQVLVLDDFHRLVLASPELPRVLAEFWRRRLRRQGRVLVVLAGATPFERSPLPAKQTVEIELGPLSHREAARFQPRWSLPEKARAWFLCGGIPHYHRLLDPSRSLEQNIEDKLLRPHARLAMEPELLLRTELRDAQGFHAVLSAMAEGHQTARAIAEGSGIPERSLHYYFNQIEALGFLDRRHPLTAGPVKTRVVRYALTDPLFAFWFRLVFPHLSLIRQTGPAQALSRHIRPALAAFWEQGFTRLCRHALPGFYRRLGFVNQVGEYWDKNVQLDVVGIREDGWTDLGVCRWSPVRSSAKLLQDLEKRVLAYPNPRGDAIGRRLFVRKVPKGAQRSRAFRWFSLEDVYR